MSQASLPPGSRSTGWIVGKVAGAPVIISYTSLLLGLIIAGSWAPSIWSSMQFYGATKAFAVTVATVVGAAVSILAHELSHGLSGTLLGARPLCYELYLWGGRTTFDFTHNWKPWKEVIVCLSGPGANLILWAIGDALVNLNKLPWAATYTIWIVARLNLMLAIFNILPALPLDGGQALCALVEQFTGRPRWGSWAAGFAGFVVVAALIWHWLLQDLLLYGQRPDAFSLILILMVAWPLCVSSWRTFGLDKTSRVAKSVNLVEVAHPVLVLKEDASLEEIKAALAKVELVIIPLEAGRKIGIIDAITLQEISTVNADGVLAKQICMVVPPQAITNQLQGSEALAALRSARQLCRWLLIIHDGRFSGAVPTGAN